MKQIDLWNIYYMATNAALDVWTQEDFLQGKITQNQVNQQKLRLTFPIKWLRTLASGEKLYLVCQLNSNPHWKSLNIPSSLKRQDSKIHGFILPINIRIASENEFIEYKKTIVVDKQERKLFLNDVWYKLNNDSWLKWRSQKVQEVLVGKYDNDDQKSIIQLIRYSQFDPIELKQRK